MQRKSYLRRLPPTEPRYTKFQIAMRYFPDDNFATASRKLRRWIRDDPPLNEALRRVGYHTSQKYFSQAHFEVLKEYLGEPLE